MRLLVAVLAAAAVSSAALVPSAAWAQAPDINVVRPTFETKTLRGNVDDADGDDPAVWIAPGDRGESLVVTAVKNGGIRVYDLGAKLVQSIPPAPDGGRINNVDVVYWLAFADGSKVDVAVASDRGLDVIRIFRIERGGDAPLTEITAADAGRAFPERPRKSGLGLEPNPLDDQNTVYGLTTWNNRDAGEVLVIGTQRGEPRVGVFRLEPRAGGKVAAVYQRDFRVPVVHDGQNLRQESDDPLRDWSPQFEGLAVDQRNGILYAGQEDVGIWRLPLKAGADAEPRLIYATRGSTESSFNNASSVIARDVEGLCIFYGEDGKGYLIASSQGGAHGDAPAPDAPYDDTFAVFVLSGAERPSLVGSFRVARKGDIDAVQESDGAEVISFGLPGFEKGLFITQDGYDGDRLSGEPPLTNFKFVAWEDIARSFTPRLTIAPRAYNPRTGR